MRLSRRAAISSTTWVSEQVRQRLCSDRESRRDGGRMSTAETLRRWVNSSPAPVGVAFETLAAQRAEARHLERWSSGGSSTVSCPCSPAFESLDAERILERVRFYGGDGPVCPRRRRTGLPVRRRLFRLLPTPKSPMPSTRDLRPRRIVEVGSGNGARLFREAIRDGGIAAELVSMNPGPRREVEGVADRVVRRRVRGGLDQGKHRWLGAGDFLFIDSSHEIEAGNDVVTLLLRVVPPL